MFNLIKEYKIKGAYDKLFYNEKKQLKPEAKIVLEHIRDICSGKGELVKDGSPFLYAGDGKMDASAAAFYLGRRHIYDLFVKYLALDEVEMFKLMQLADKNPSEILLNDLTSI